MSELYSMVIKAKDGLVSAKAFEQDGVTKIAFAQMDGQASVFTESLSDELAPYKHDRKELIRLVKDILNDDNVYVNVRPMMAVHINEDGNYVFTLGKEYTTLDGDHPSLGFRMTGRKHKNSSLSGGPTNKNARLFGKK